MKFLIVVSVFLLVGCAARQPYEPIFSDSEKSKRSQQFDEWFSKAVKGL